MEKKGKKIHRLDFTFIFKKITQIRVEIAGFLFFC